ncbi:hypothetical protein HVIM_03975 [Roseomonas mucosa]|nr:hypothetical protein HVIM_03975 [Roseomonas mucosa]QDD98187.1 hypothetical protein ADP8_03975 [Roseomonas mucosa]UZO90379.1 Hypothetical protein RMP42_03975 [Roseomonas mucosa]
MPENVRTPGSFAAGIIRIRASRHRHEHAAILSGEEQVPGSGTGAAQPCGIMAGEAGTDVVVVEDFAVEHTDLCQEHVRMLRHG